MWIRKLTSNISLQTIRKYTQAENLLVSGRTMAQLKEDLRIIMGVEKGYKPIRQSREPLNKYLAKDVSELPPRNIKDSYLYGIIPLSVDQTLQEKYIGNWGLIRLGRLMEDLDIFAGGVMVLQKYVLNPKVPPGDPYPYSIVTVLVSSINFTEFRAKAAEDIRISGHVTCVGNSSASVVVWLEQMHYGKWNRITQSNIILAARDATNTLAAIINPLVALNAKEQEVMKIGCELRKLILLKDKMSLTKTLPTLEEQQIIHHLYLTGCGKQVTNLRKLPTGCSWMENSALKNAIFSFPEDRNLHNTVFGGFLIRMSMELSRALCIIYTKKDPTLIGISDVGFKKPIEVGSIIKMHAHVVYTNMNFVQIIVYVDAVNRRKVLQNATTVFYLTYELPDIVSTVLPYTYRESMMYIDGLRHFRHIMHNEEIKFESIYSPDEDFDAKES